MTPVAMPFFPSHASDPIEQLKRQDANCRAFGVAVEQFLKDVWPGHLTIGPMVQRWIEWQCTGTEEQIRAMEEAREFQKAHPFPSGYYPSPKTAEEQLVDLVAQRDKKQHLVDTMKSAFENMRGSSFPEELIPIMELQLQPLIDDLERTEGQLSDLQRSIEQRAHAESPTVDAAGQSAGALNGAD
jgi:hypothetical protein